ncbi:MAG: CpsD/CapB family tyrosine-protein kinase [Phycisphaerae bacterium]|nr:CpsD/CapB family tyrosine-protein kinase [Phycisphaerae bacterium]
MFEEVEAELDSDPTQEVETEDFSAPVAASSAGKSAASLSKRSAEVFRGIWASLFYSGQASGTGLVITASSRGEGASTMACGLALSGSGPDAGAKVALVDFNLRSPEVHKLLGVNQSPGVTEVLLEGQDVASVAQQVGENLDVIAAGNAAGKSLELLKSKGLDSFFERLLKDYDYVIVDAAPVNAFPDAQILGSVLKETALVVKSDAVPREAVAQAKKRIESGGGKVVGIILNMRTYPIPNFLYRRV